MSRATEVEMVIPPGKYQKNLGNQAMRDPTGTSHSHREIAGRVVVAIFSVPDMAQGDRQQRWSTLLADNPKTMLPKKIVLLLFEDMSQAGAFKKRAMSDMKKEFTPDSRPFLIIDADGKAFKKFGIPRNTTEIRIFDKKGKLRDVETDLDNEKLTLARITAITTKLQAE